MVGQFYLGETKRLPHRRDAVIKVIANQLIDKS